MPTAYATPARPPSIAELLPTDPTQLTFAQRASLRVTVWLLLRSRTRATAVTHDEMRRIRENAASLALRQAAALHMSQPARF